MNLREMSISFCTPLNFLKMENTGVLFILLYLSLFILSSLKIGCIQPILALLGANTYILNT